MRPLDRTLSSDVCSSLRGRCALRRENKKEEGGGKEGLKILTCEGWVSLPFTEACPFSFFIFLENVLFLSRKSSHFFPVFLVWRTFSFLTLQVPVNFESVSEQGMKPLVPGSISALAFYSPKKTTCKAVTTEPDVTKCGILVYNLQYNCDQVEL